MSNNNTVIWWERPINHIQVQALRVGKFNVKAPRWNSHSCTSWTMFYFTKCSQYCALQLMSNSVCSSIPFNANTDMRYVHLYGID